MSNDTLSLNKLYALLGKVVQFSGFGEQSQASVLQGLTQHKQYQNKFHYATVLAYARMLE